MICHNDRCRKEITPIVIYQNSGTDNIEGLPHEDLKCPVCGLRFHRWLCGEDRLKQVFGGTYCLYK